MNDHLATSIMKQSNPVHETNDHPKVCSMIFNADNSEPFPEYQYDI